MKETLQIFAVRNTTKCLFCKRIKVKEPLFLAFYKRVWFNIISWRDNSALCCVSDCKDLECFLQNQFLRWVRYKLCTLVTPLIKGIRSVGNIKKSKVWHAVRHLVVILCIKLNCFSLPYRCKKYKNYWKTNYSFDI